MTTGTRDKRTEKPTLRTIAELSGLAVPTVSRALNDAPDIGKDTKARVRAIARDIGYVPNRAGVRLRTGRTNVISVVMSTDNDLSNHTGRFVTAIAETLRDTAFHLNFSPFFADQDPLRPFRYIVETRSADAVILNQTEPEDPRVAYLQEHGFPFVTHGRTKWSDSHSYYDVCNRDIGSLAVKFLARRGRRNLLAIAPPAHQSYGLDFRNGVLEAGSETGVSVEIASGVTSDDPRDQLAARITAILQENPRIDGMITASSSAAMAATAGLETAGRRLGADIEFFSKETTEPILELFRPQIHTIKENVQEAGEWCGHAVKRLLREPHLPPMQTLRHPTEDDIFEGV